MSKEEVKQEGDFKLKRKKVTPKKLNKKEEITKVDLTKPEAQGEVIPDVIKVEIPKEDAVQTQETDDSNVIVEEPKDSGDSKEVVEEVRTTEETVESPIEIIEEVAEVEKELKEAVKDEQVLGKQLPENIEKLVSFMEETGGGIEDYVRLNADYSNVDDNTLLKEYYKKEKPYLDSSDIDLLLEDFQYDEDLDEDRDIRKKKLAFKEEVAKARRFLNETKEKYYADIKLRSNVNSEAQKMQQQFEYDMKLKQMDVQAMQQKEQSIEDRKDKRTKIQATQQSEMISQRKNDGLPIDFENQPDQGLGAFM